MCVCSFFFEDAYREVQGRGRGRYGCPSGGISDSGRMRVEKCDDLGYTFGRCYSSALSVQTILYPRGLGSLTVRRTALPVTQRNMPIQLLRLGCCSSLTLPTANKLTLPISSHAAGIYPGLMNDGTMLSKGAVKRLLSVLEIRRTQGPDAGGESCPSWCCTEGWFFGREELRVLLMIRVEVYFRQGLEASGVRLYLRR